MTVPDVDHQSPEHRARDEQDTASAPVGTTIQRTRGVCGGAARIRNTRYTVCGLVEWRQLGLSDSEILERHPDLTQADLNTAWAYYKRNREEIDQAIRANQEA